MPKILVSACLIGQKVRYDAKDCFQSHQLFQQWVKDGNVVAICPEMAGGLPAPRPPSEIEFRKTAQDIINGQGKVLTIEGRDVSREYIKGAEKALELARKNNIHVAILKSRSPSCGSKNVYDGTHTRTLLDGMGVTAKLLSENGIEVFDETEIDLALEKAK